MVVGFGLGCCATAACCAGRTACSGLCCCFTACGVKPKSLPKLGYVMMQLFCVLIAFVMMFTLKPLADNIDKDLCVGDEDYSKMTDLEIEASESACFGVSAVLRMTFALVIFHALILILILGRNECASIIHDGGWAFKVIIVLALYIGFFWLPLSFIKVWAEVSRYIGIIFLLIQVLYILDGAYTYNEYMKQFLNEDGSANWQSMVMIIYTLLALSASVGIIIGSFFWFLGNSDSSEKCSLNLGIIISTIVMILVVFVLWVREDSSVLTSALVNFWLTYLMWSGLASNPDAQCNTLLSSGWTTVLQIFSHLIWTWITLFSLSTAIVSDGEEKGASKVAQLVAEEDDGTKVVDAEDVKITVSPNEEPKSGSEEYVFPVSLATLIFQVVLMIVCCHYSMVMTNWGDPVINNDKSNFFAENKVSFWIKIVMQWLSFLIYLVS